jgi:excisionase family DNA binding protein
MQTPEPPNDVALHCLRQIHGPEWVAGYREGYRNAGRFFIIETPPKPEGALYNTEEAAAFMCISQETVRRLFRAKLLTHVSVTGTDYRFTLRDLKEYIEAHRHERLKGV